MKLENLESQLFIEELGNVKGGIGNDMTTYAEGPEEDGTSLGWGPTTTAVYEDGGYYPGLPSDLEKRIGNMFDEITSGIQPPVTTLALGEES